MGHKMGSCQEKSLYLVATLFLPKPRVCSALQPLTSNLRMELRLSLGPMQLPYRYPAVLSQ
jgi:hypothetical protein